MSLAVSAATSETCSWKDYSQIRVVSVSLAVELHRMIRIPPRITKRLINLHINDVGGALSFCARNDEVLFVLGAREGRLASEGTLIVSRLLWPGTPSKMAAVFGFVPLVVGGVVFLGVSGIGTPSLNEAALVMRGLIAGAFVEAT